MLLLPINSFSQTRGERNNNPGNLKSVKILTYEIGKDKDGFSVFATKEDGLKAVSYPTLKLWGFLLQQTIFTSMFGIVLKYSSIEEVISFSKGLNSLRSASIMLIAL